MLTTPYVVDEVAQNRSGLSPGASRGWESLRRELTIGEDVLTPDQAAVFEPAKDRPILFSALAWADVLLALDRADFGAILCHTFYGLAILTPGLFLERERAAGRLTL